MIPGPYNNNYQILQTPGYVVILHEMIHDARIIPLDGRPHVGQNVRQWFGDSRGRWEGNTLVVDTTNFTDKANYRGSTEGLHLIERFTRVNADTVKYEFTIDDPTTFTKKWTAAIPMAKTDEQIYEYACHEGNYGMVNLLKGRKGAGEGAGKYGGSGSSFGFLVLCRAGSRSCPFAEGQGAKADSPQFRRHLELCDHHSTRASGAVEGQGRSSRPRKLRRGSSRWLAAIRAGTGTGTGTYNTFFREFGTRTVKTLRTSIITDPPDGRIPALTPAAAAVKQRRLAGLKHPASAQETGLQDRCLAMVTTGPPMLPYSYNSNYQIIQTRDSLVIHVEMIHDTRIIPLNGRPHLPSNIRLWKGDSVGRWEGDTLVVDTTNFNDGGGFYGDAGGNFGWDRNLHLIERFSLLDKNTLLYRFEVDNPTAFTQPWKGELTMTRATGPMYEFACHEGNYALPNMLNGERATEK